MRHIAVLGAGVSGLTCAIVLRERGYEVDVFAEKSARESTSGVASAIWFPYHIGDGADAREQARIDAWTKTTFLRFVDLIPCKEAGVSMMEFRHISRNYIPLPPWDVPKPRRLKKSDLREGWRSGYLVSVPLIETPSYLPYLEKRFDRDPIREPGIERIADVADKYEVIVNCRGIRAPELSDNDDSLMRPGRGVVVIGKTSLEHAVLDSDGEAREN